MSAKGWIKLHRGLQDSEIWHLDKFTRGQAWVDMLLMANHEDKTFFLRGIEIKVKRGQIARSKESLAKKWRWSRGKVLRFFSWLETRQQITQQKSKLLSIVTIINYHDYQQSGTTNRTTDGQQTEQQTDTNKNVKNEKKNSFVEDSTEFRLSRLLFSLIQKRNPNHKSPNLQTWAKQIDFMVRIDNRKPDEIEKIIRWTQQDEFWQNNILSTTKLRKQYDQLILKMPTLHERSTGSKLLDDYYAKNTDADR